MDTRASDAERHAAIERLRDAGGEGRLTYEELADRVGAAASASTRAELEVLTADLPQEVGASPAATVAVRSSQRAAVFGDVVGEGRWVVPERSRWLTLFGDVRIDLRDAIVASPVVYVHAGLVFGDVEIVVPEGVAVELRAGTIFGDVKQETTAGGPVASSDAPRVVVGGWSVFGDVKVVSRRLRESRLLRR